jgi:UDP-3-O-[3-hydroxymyristoyl] glucosamine N-acyltransferase
MKQIPVYELTNLITNYKLIGNKAKYFSNVKVITEANEDSLAWISPSKPDKQQLLEQTSAGVIICDSTLNFENLSENKCCIVVENPKLEFLRVVNKLFVHKKQPEIHPTAIINKEAKIGINVNIGPYTIIGNCTIGDSTSIESNCRIFDNVLIGNNVTIHTGAVIGSEGFGYSKQSNGESEHFPHIGGVIIEDNVDIGANTCIDRGSLGNTIIGQGVKIDNLVHIAHNVVVEKNAYIIANAMIGGSTKIGESSWVAPGASLRDSIVIGKFATVGLGAVVTKNIPDGEIWMGNPAKKFIKN